jgi:hypothetical protein
MELNHLLSVVEVFVYIFMPACGFFLVPPTFKSYLKWSNKKNPHDFSSMLIQGAFALCFLISVFPLFASHVIGFYHLQDTWLYCLLVSLGMGALMGYWTLPRMLSYCQKLKSEKTTVHFTLMVFFGFLSFYGFASFFVIILHSAISAINVPSSIQSH